MNLLLIPLPVDHYSDDLIKSSFPRVSTTWDYIRPMRLFDNQV